MEHYNIGMFVLDDFAKTLLGILGKWAKKKLDGKQKFLRLLKALEPFGLGQLKADHRSVYTHALVQYAVEANPVELLGLFGHQSVYEAYSLREDNKELFLKALAEKLKKNDIPLLGKIYTSVEALQPEIKCFKDLYDFFTLQSSNPMQLKQYNETNHFMMTMLKDLEVTREEKERKSFPFQADRYMEQLRQPFKEKFIDTNHYIHLDAEQRKPRTDFSTVSPTGPDAGRKNKEENYDTVVYSPVDQYVEQWLAREDSRLLVIFGEYGTGKTTYVQYLAYRMAGARLHTETTGTTENAENETQQAAPPGPDGRCRIPLYFPLRDFEKEIEPFIVTQCSRAGIHDIDYPAFLQRAAQGEFVVLLDGFDEMTQKVDADEKGRNFEKIRRLMEAGSKCKFILTVRSEYFLSAADIDTVFRPGSSGDMDFLHLRPLNDAQIQEFLCGHTDDPGYYWELIQKVFDLHDLAKRPVLLQLMVDHLPDVIAEKGKQAQISASDLYRSCIAEELRRKSDRLKLQIPNKYRLKILRELAVWMFCNDALSFDTGSEEIRGLLRRYVEVDLEWEFEKYLNEFLTFNFLIRESDYRFRISHKSFRDYLTACQLTAEVAEGVPRIFGKTKITEEIIHFMLEQGPDKQKLLDLVLTCRADDYTEETQWQGSNGARVLLKMDRGIFKGKDLAGCRLVSVSFWEYDLSGTGFENADVSGCRFDENALGARFNNTEAARALLDLESSGLTDKDILLFKGLKHLSKLNLYGNQVSDISVLKDLEHLTELNFSENEVSDISVLKDLKHLTKLNFSENEVSDISALKDLKNLHELNLDSNEVSDISALMDLKNLHELNLDS
ncbi:MAG: hypothetical protein GY765_25930, partial [bacterium]|nr:hypothetical protein [bacterium]